MEFKSCVCKGIKIFSIIGPCVIFKKKNYLNHLLYLHCTHIAHMQKFSSIIK